MVQMAAPALETFMERAGCGVGRWGVVERMERRRSVRSLAKTLGVKAAEVKFSGGGARPKSENHE